MEDNDPDALAHREADPVEDLQMWLEQQGADPPPGELSLRLSRIWDQFEGSDAGGMRGFKLLKDRHGERLETSHWGSPRLEFKIVRHGALVRGSTRGELQHWLLDFNLRTARLSLNGYRVVGKTAPPIDVKQLARELAKIVVSHSFSDDRRIDWLPGSRVLIVVGEIPELTKVVAQTKTTRRKRFRQALVDEMRAVGFELDVAARGWRAEYQFCRRLVA